MFLVCGSCSCVHAASSLCIQRQMDITKGESFLPLILYLPEYLESHSSPLNRATGLVAAVSLHSYREVIVGKGFWVEGLRFLKAKTPYYVCSCPASQEGLGSVLWDTEVLTDRCSVSFLPAGGPTGESLVTTAGCSLGDLGWCTC